jgi:CBS domain-containing protein
VNIIIPDVRTRHVKAISQYIRDRLPTRVADVMTKDVVTLSPDDNFAEAVELMAKRDFRHLMVADDAQKLLGVISDRDILRATGRVGDWSPKQIRHVMTADPISVMPETLLSRAASTMVRKKINCLPVVDVANVVCGIVTSTDILTCYQKTLESLESLQK